MAEKEEEARDGGAAEGEGEGAPRKATADELNNFRKKVMIAFTSFLTCTLTNYNLVFRGLPAFIGASCTKKKQQQKQLIFIKVYISVVCGVGVCL